MHAGGSGVKLDDDIHLSWLGPESFSLLLCLSGSVPGNSFGVLECGLSQKFPTCGLRPGVCNTYKIFKETFGQNETMQTYQITKEVH